MNETLISVNPSNIVLGTQGVIDRVVQGIRVERMPFGVKLTSLVLERFVQRGLLKLFRRAPDRST